MILNCIENWFSDNYIYEQLKSSVCMLTIRMFFPLKYERILIAGNCINWLFLVIIWRLKPDHFFRLVKTGWDFDMISLLKLSKSKSRVMISSAKLLILGRLYGWALGFWISLLKSCSTTNLYRSRFNKLILNGSKFVYNLQILFYCVWVSHRVSSIAPSEK